MRARACLVLQGRGPVSEAVTCDVCMHKAYGMLLLVFFLFLVSLALPYAVDGDMMHKADGTGGLTDRPTGGASDSTPQCGLSSSCLSILRH